jgi:hypothetical protein
MIKTVRGVSTKDRKVVIMTSDDAIDLSKSDLDKYQEEFNEEFLTFKEGQEPTRFILRPCSQKEFRDASIAIYGRDRGDDADDVTIIGIGAELLKKALVGAKSLYEAGDEHHWPGGAGSSSVLEEIPAMIQINLAMIVMQLSRGSVAKSELGDEKK